MRDALWLIPFLAIFLVLQIAVPLNSEIATLAMMLGKTDHIQAWSIALIITTIGVSLAFGLIQAFVARKWTKDSLFWVVFKVGAMTTAFIPILLITPVERPIIPFKYVGWMFLISVLLETVLFRVTDALGKRSWSRCLGTTAVMNTASYGALVLAMALLMFVPTAWNENSALRREISGEIFIASSGGSAFSPRIPLKFDAKSGSAQSAPSFNPYVYAYIGKEKITSLDYNGDPDWMPVLGNDAVIHLARASSANIHLPAQITSINAVSEDGALAYCNAAGKGVIYDLKKKAISRVLPKNPPYTYGSIFSRDKSRVAFYCDASVWLLNVKTGAIRGMGPGNYPCFNPKTSQLAWVAYPKYHNLLVSAAKSGPRYDISNAKANIKIMDCETGAVKSLPLPNEFTKGLAWSADGRFFAYIGRSLNPYIKCFSGEYLQVITADGKSSCSLARIDNDSKTPLVSTSIEWLK